MGILLFRTVQTADSGKVTLLGLLDVSAAFDTVDHNIFLTAFTCRLVSAVQSCPGLNPSSLAGPSQSTSAKTSPLLRLLSAMSHNPLLFLLYTADVLKIVQHNGLSGHSYADDTSIYTFIQTPASALPSYHVSQSASTT